MNKEDIQKMMPTLMGDLKTYTMMKEVPNNDLIHRIYSHIIALRMIGIIIHNSDSTSSIKMEKLRIEDRTRDLERDNTHLAQQLAECRSLLDSKKIEFNAVG